VSQIKLKGAVLLSALLTVLFLSSCTLMDKLGFDTYNYMGEEITASYEGDSDTAKKLLPMLSVLITDSVFLPEFDNMGQAIVLYRDAVLSHMLENGYSKYSGNAELIAKASAEYSQYLITLIIPSDDFERTMYEYFGGSVKISHGDGTLFKYLKKVGAYICGMVPSESGVSAEIISVDETEKTYRVRFRCIAADGTEAEYFALIIKREDGTHYFKQIIDCTVESESLAA
jgi:hypothetical protein